MMHTNLYIYIFSIHTIIYNEVRAMSLLVRICWLYFYVQPVSLLHVVAIAAQMLKFTKNFQVVDFSFDQVCKGIVNAIHSPVFAQPNKLFHIVSTCLCPQPNPTPQKTVEWVLQRDGLTQTSTIYLFHILHRGRTWHIACSSRPFCYKSISILVHFGVMYMGEYRGQGRLVAIATVKRARPQMYQDCGALGTQRFTTLTPPPKIK